MLPRELKPASVPGLVRIGPSADGGYFVVDASIAATKLLIGFGLNDDWRFEEHFIGLAKCPTVVFDHTVDGRFWAMRLAASAAKLALRRGAVKDLFKYWRYRTFFAGANAHERVKIGYDTEGSISLDTILKKWKARPIFLKMDIEGSEYRILDTIIEHAGEFSGMAIEFHDVDLHRETIKKFVSAVESAQTLVYIQANNNGAIDNIGDPLLLECSFCHKSLLSPSDDTTKAPAPRPVKNVPGRPTIDLRFEV